MKLYACFPLLGALLAVPAARAEDVTPVRPEDMPPARAVSSGRPADFTLRIPLRLARIYPEAQVRLACVIGGTSATGMIGQGWVVVPVDASGGYSGTVVVAINAAEGKDPASASGYQCAIWFRRASDPASFPPCLATDPDPPCQRWRAAQSVLRARTDGRFP